MIATARLEPCNHAPPSNDRDWISREQEGRQRAGRRPRVRVRRTAFGSRRVTPKLAFGDVRRPDPQYDQIVFRFRLKVKARFESLADTWERETRNMSSPNAAERHPAYGQIIDMGKPVIPWILRRLAEYPSFWFAALSAITKERDDPVKPWMLGNVCEMADAWLRWGEAHGYIRASENRNC
jgi:hypothetical protein